MRLAIVSVLAVVASLALYTVPLVRYLVWLNAAAISIEVHKPGLVVPIAILEVLAMAGVLWAVIWKGNQCLKPLVRK